MRKMSVAVLILALIISGWISERIILNTMSDDMIDKLDKVTIALEAENFEDAAVYTDEFCDSWYKSESKIAMLTPHSEVDEISRNAAKMKTYTISGGKDDAIATVAETKELLDEIERKTRVNLMNIF